MGSAGVKIYVILKFLPPGEGEGHRRGMNYEARLRKPRYGLWPWGAPKGAKGRQGVVGTRIPSKADHATVEGTQHPGSIDKMGRQDFLEEVTFEPSPM